MDIVEQVCRNVSVHQQVLEESGTPSFSYLDVCRYLIMLQFHGLTDDMDYRLWVLRSPHVGQCSRSVDLCGVGFPRGFTLRVNIYS